MTNKQIDRMIAAFSKTRQDWIDILVKNPDSTDAAQYILSINSKIELLKSMYDYSQEITQ